MLYSLAMTTEMRKLAIKHLAAFAAAQGIPDDHLEYFKEHFTADELKVGGNALLADSDARPLMVNAYRKLTGIHNYVDAPEAEIVHQIVNQINLMRSGFINGMFGNMDGIEE